MDAAEAFTNAGVGLVVSWIITMYALPFWGYAPGAGQAAGITATYFLVSFARAWFLRWAFRTWQEKR